MNAKHIQWMQKSAEILKPIVIGKSYEEAELLVRQHCPRSPEGSAVPSPVFHGESKKGVAILNGVNLFLNEQFIVTGVTCG